MSFTQRDNSIRRESDVIVTLSRLRSDVQELGFSDHDVTRVVTAASELARNILKYAESGNLSYCRLVDGSVLGVEVTAQDRGPGIDDIEAAMEDRYSTSGTLGLGLPGVKRLVDEFDLKSESGAGTTVTFKVWGG